MPDAQREPLREGEHWGTVNPDHRQGVRRAEWLTLPNVVTLARFALVIPIAIVMLGGEPFRLAGPALTLVFAATDWLDGFLARRLGQVSRVGTIIDPIADRTGIAVICFVLVLVGIVPWWILAAIVLTDAVVALVTFAKRTEAALTVTWMGKIRTALIMAGLVTASLGTAEIRSAQEWAFGAQVVLTVGAVLHVTAGIGYLRQLVAR